MTGLRQRVPRRAAAKRAWFARPPGGRVVGVKSGVRRLATVLFVLAAALHMPPMACCAAPTANDGGPEVDICSMHGIETISWSDLVGETTPHEAPAGHSGHDCCDGCIGGCRAGAAAPAIAPTPTALVQRAAFHLSAAPPPTERPLASAPARVFAARGPPAFS